MDTCLSSLEETYPRLECDVTDLTTQNPADMLVNVSALSVTSSSSNASSVSSQQQHHQLQLRIAQQATEMASLHGATVLPEILTRDVAQTLRDYIITQRNPHITPAESLDVIVNEYRSSFALSAVEDSSVVSALHQIGQSVALSATLQALAGSDNPALVE